MRKGSKDGITLGFHRPRVNLLKNFEYFPKGIDKIFPNVYNIREINFYFYEHQLAYANILIKEVRFMFEFVQSANALAALAILMYVSFRLKRALKSYARFGCF